MKTIYHKILSVVFMAAAAGVTSCTLDSTEEAVVGKQQSSDVVLNIRTTSVDNVTRSVTKIIDGYSAGNNTTVSTDEQKMSNLIVGLFKSEGNTLDIQQVNVTAGDAVASSQQISSTYSSSLGDGAKPANGDLVRVAINLPADKITEITNKTENVWNKNSETLFQNTALTIDQALDMDNDKAVEPAELPMVGNSTMTFNNTLDKWESSVTVHHLVAKVTLASLKVDFSSTKHAAATFKPTEIFLTGVPDKINLDMSDGIYAFTQGAYATSYYQGESTVSGDTKKDYLGTGTGIDDATLNATTTTYGTAYTLYTMPNNNSASNLTYLVVKGTYSSDGNAWNAKTVYYPIFIGISTDNKVVPDAHYVVNAVIKGEGATAITGLKDLGTSDFSTATPSTIQDMDVTVTVTDFADEAVTATFTNSGVISYSAQDLPDPVVGDLLFSDGMWGSLDNFPTKTPVGIVFSTAVSAADIAAGYKHGYAIALKTVGTGVAAGTGDASMGWSTESVQLGTTDNGYPAVNLGSNELVDAYAASARYMDGRSETALMTNRTGYSNSTYPAAYAAVTTYASTVAPPTGASNWYLPSIGQWYELIKVFGGITGYPDTYRPDLCDCYWDNKGSATATAINAYAAAKLKSTTHSVDFSSQWVNIYFVSSGTSGYYWSSTESAMGAGYAFGLYFGYDGKLYLAGNLTKSDSPLRVRPVIAF